MEGVAKMAVGEGWQNGCQQGLNWWYLRNKKRDIWSVKLLFPPHTYPSIISFPCLLCGLWPPQHLSPPNSSNLPQFTATRVDSSTVRISVVVIIRYPSPPSHSHSFANHRMSLSTYPKHKFSQATILLQCVQINIVTDLPLNTITWRITIGLILRCMFT